MQHQPIITNYVMDRGLRFPHVPAMLEKQALVDALKAKVASGDTTQVAIAQVIGVPPPRISELFKGGRDLSLDEGCKLIRHFKLEPPTVLEINEADLEEMLRGAQLELPAGLPFAEWPRALASALRTRLELLAGVDANTGNSDDEAESARKAGAQPPAATKQGGDE